MNKHLMSMSFRSATIAFAPDFRQLLSKPMDSVEKPKPLPAGTYEGLIQKHELGESSQKKTPFVRLFVTVTAPGADIPAEDLEGVDLSKKQLRKDFFLTEDALYRFKEAAESLGVSTTGRSLGEIIPDLVNLPCLIEVTQRTSQDGTEIFNDVGSLKGQG